MIERERTKMHDSPCFSNTIYIDQTHRAERELSSFINAVTELFGAEQAQVATEDWLEEAELMDSAPRSISRDWRSVTIAAAARLANRIDAAQHRHRSLSASNAEASRILSSNRFATALLANPAT
jgi:hypothetical protein